MTAAELLDAARREEESRAKAYPALVASGRRDLVVDWQAWVCIVGWLSSGHFQIIDRGGHDEATRIGWPEAEAAAAAAVAKTREAATAAEQAGEAAKALRLCIRAAALAAIARKVSLRRESIDDLNAHFQRQREQRIAA